MATPKRYGYLLVFVIPALMPMAGWLATHTAHPDLAAWFPLFFLFVLLPLADYAIGRDAANPADGADIQRLENERWFRWLTLACVPVQLSLIAYSTWMFVALPFTWVGALGWLWSQGVISGVLGINVAHELVHKRERVEQLAGGVLLASVGYATFKVEHVRGHHVHVSTPADRSSAPFGASSYAFVVRALLASPRTAGASRPIGCARSDCRGGIGATSCSGGPRSRSRSRRHWGSRSAPQASRSSRCRRWARPRASR